MNNLSVTVKMSSDYEVVGELVKVEYVRDVTRTDMSVNMPDTQPWTTYAPGASWTILTVRVPGVLDTTAGG